MSKDLYDDKPAAMKAYLSNYGWHFNKAMQEWAVSKMRDKNGRTISPITREELESMIKKYGADIKTDHIYDALYIANMVKADFYGSAIADDLHLTLFVSDYINDADGYEGQPLVRFYADTCMKEDCVIYWEDML